MIGQGLVWMHLSILATKIGFSSCMLANEAIRIVIVWLRSWNKLLFNCDQYEQHNRQL